MKKALKYVLPILALTLIYVGYTIYPQLDIVCGFSAKSIASHLFIGGQEMERTINEDNNLPSMNLATSSVDLEHRSVTTSAFNIKTRKAIFREGLGAVLLPIGKDEAGLILETPRRNRIPKPLPYPYGNLVQKDTVFQNIDYSQLKNIINRCFNNEEDHIKKTRAILVIYKDQIIGEQYAQYFNKGSVILGWSMAKSVTSTILGVMEKEGRININQTDLFQEWQDDERQYISLKNLLNMNSGLEWEEDYTKISDATKMLFLATDMSKSQIKKKQVGVSNESWNYSSGTSNLLSGYIRNQFDNQQSYLDYWYNQLIDRIGMHSMTIETDYSGHFVGSSYAWANTRDWAKLGLLYLHEGNWKGEQIIDTAWVNFTKQPTDSSDGAYGGHFWLNYGGYYPDAPRDMYSCNGFQGQRVFIIPSKDMVIVRMGLVENPGFDFNAFLRDVCGTITD